MLVHAEKSVTMPMPLVRPIHGLYPIPTPTLPLKGRGHVVPLLGAVRMVKQGSPFQNVVRLNRVPFWADGNSRIACFTFGVLPPLQGEGWGGDGVQGKKTC